MCRDLKLDNFLLATKEENAMLKATDFGLSVSNEEGNMNIYDLCTLRMCIVSQYHYIFLSIDLLRFVAVVFNFSYCYTTQLRLAFHIYLIWFQFIRVYGTLYSKQFKSLCLIDTPSDHVTGNIFFVTAKCKQSVP